MYKLSKTSKERLSTCHEDLQLIIKEALKVSIVDFGVAEGHRSIVRQRKLYIEGKSKIDGVNKKGKHNFNPSLAVDIYAYYNGSAQWDKENCIFLAGIITATANRLKKERKISNSIRWGGNWDNDGVIVHDQSFQDLVHFELI